MLGYPGETDEQFKNTLRVVEELKFDSLDGINILFALENEFDINIPDEDARQIKSIPEMVAGIEKLLAAKV